MIKKNNEITEEESKARNNWKSLFLSISVFSLIMVFSLNCGAISNVSTPDPSTFEAGDIILPKKPGKVVLYTTTENKIYEANKKQWESEKEAFIQAVRNDPNASGQDRKAVDQLEGISFGEFMSLYFGKGADWRAYAFSYRGDETEWKGLGYDSEFPIYIGHVGIIFFKDKVPWVVEAVPKQVRTISYEEWLKRYKGASVWHGRIKNMDSEVRSRIAKEACDQECRQYSLFNLRLDDCSKFYCSKLIWFSAFKVSRVSLDGDSNPDRYLWFTPKQLINSEEHVEKKFKPNNEEY